MAEGIPFMGTSLRSEQKVEQRAERSGRLTCALGLCKAVDTCFIFKQVRK